MSNILVTRASLPPINEYIDEISDIWDSHWLTNMGEKHERLRERLCEYLAVSNIELFTNGHMALEMSLQALDLPVGGEVITTPYTFASTIHAIVRNNLKPIFCDIKKSDYTIDETKIEGLITDKTVAIMPVHVYGNICDYKSIESVAKKYNLRVIYDAAHSFGEVITDNFGKDLSVGSFGDISVFSFHATKVFNTIEGGSACYHDEAIGHKLYNLKNFGITGYETVESVGANAKMTEFCAAMGLCNLKHVDAEIAKRKAVHEKYVSLLDGIAGITIKSIQKDVKSNYAYFPIVVDESVIGKTRDDIFEVLAANGIHARKYFYPIASEYDCYKNEYDVNDTPIAKWVSDRVLTLPMYSDLALEDVEKICRIILDEVGISR